MKYIPYNHHSIDNDDIKEVIKVLKSEWLTQGPKVKEFEDSLCRYTGAEYAVVVSSGTAALHLSMLSLGTGKDDCIVTTPITFSASANCALYVGARPFFVDIDDASYHIDLNALKDFIKNKHKKNRLKTVLPVHFMGTVAPVEEIKRICDRYGIKIVEDACHAIGAKYKTGRNEKWIKVGSCFHSDISIFSFHPIKNITTGEGGAILTNNRKIYERCLKLRQHGISRDKSRKAIVPGMKLRDLQWRYDVSEIGYNYRITDFQCAMGISQLNKIEGFNKKKKELVKNYNRNFASFTQIQLPYEREKTYAAYHIYVIRVPAYLRDKLYLYLRKNNIATQVNYIPVHLLSFYRRNFGYKWGDFPQAERYFKECLSLPLYPDLTFKQQTRIINLIKKFLTNEL